MDENNRKQFRVTEDILAKLERRFFNFVIDMLLLVILISITLAVMITVTTANGDKNFINRFLSNSLGQYMLTAGITVLYYNLFEIFTSRTIGKFCTNTIVVNENGDKADYEAIMIRSLIRIIPLYWLSFIVFPTRGLHDMISKTYVVNKKELEESKSQFYALK